MISKFIPARLDASVFRYSANRGSMGNLGLVDDKARKSTSCRIPPMASLRCT
jgi:hypothetical protein